MNESLECTELINKYTPAQSRELKEEFFREDKILALSRFTS